MTITAPMPPPVLSPSAVQLQDYQQVTKDFLVRQPHAAIFLQMGFGKTLTTLDTFNTVMPQGHILVVAPLNIVRSTWVDEIEKWGYNVRTKSLILNDNGNQFTRERRLERYREALHDQPTMWFINQELIHDLVDYMAHRFDDRMVVALLDQIAVRVSPELDAKVRSKFAMRNDAGMLNDIAKLFTTTVKDAQQAQAMLAAGDPDPKVEARLAKKAQRTAALAVGIDGALLDLIATFPAKWAQSTGLKLRPAIWPFQTVVIDESQGFKSPSSRRWKAMKAIRPAVTRLIEMTGTPTPNGLLDLWAQVYLLDEGKALGRTMTAYKERWFYPTRYVDNRPVAWEPREGAEQEIYDAVKHLVMSVENTSLQLPPFTVNDVYVHLDSDEMEAYREFKRESVLDLVTNNGDSVSISASNAAVLSAKLTQFASGTIYTPPSVCTKCDGRIDRSVDIEEGPSGEEVPVVVLSHADPSITDHEPSPVGQHSSWEIVHDRKIEHLDYILRNSPDPVIVAYRFVSDRKRLVKELAALGHQVVVFDGSREMVKNWNAKQYPVMLLQPASAGHGLNLQDGGSTLVWYTLPVSLEHYLQTNARLHRQGQTKPVVVHRLITKGTYDEQLPRMLQDKKITQDDLIEAVMIEIGDLGNPWISVGGFSDDDDNGFDVYELL